MGGLLPHDRQKRVGAAAISLHDAGELVAFADPHAGAVDLHVGDDKMPPAIGNMPLQLGRAALTRDLARDDRLVALLPRAGNPERRPAKAGPLLGMQLSDT